jgi:ATP-binding cassette subfamily B protein
MQSTIENCSGNELVTINKIVFSNVEFGFEQNIKVLMGVDFEINKGQKVAIVGSSGSGKTTIAKLLMKFHSAEVGNIYINGEDILNISTESIRTNIVYVSQEDFIFSGSIKENLKFGNETISDETMLDMAQVFGIHDFVKDMPRLYDSILEERGANLSKGQKQKIALTRAILRKPKVLILDEATSNMDLMSENKILNELKDMKDLTLIIITHRLDSILNSDCIYVMEEGCILARGNHKELLNICPKYEKSYSN